MYFNQTTKKILSQIQDFLAVKMKKKKKNHSKFDVRKKKRLYVNEGFLQLNINILGQKLHSRWKHTSSLFLFVSCGSYLEPFYYSILEFSFYLFIYIIYTLIQFFPIVSEHVFEIK